MKLAIGLFLLLFLSLIGLVQSQENADLAKTNKKERDSNPFMRRKSRLAQDALEGLVTEDFKLITETADSLERMSRQAQWDVFRLDEYNQLSAEFRRIARSMAKQAEQKNIDGSATAYLQLTLSCVECHKFTRGVKLADGKPASSKMPMAFAETTDHFHFRDSDSR